jgi:hypothetical protein
LAAPCRLEAGAWSFYIFHAAPAGVREREGVEYREVATAAFLPVGKVTPVCTIFPTGRKNRAEFS